MTTPIYAELAEQHGVEVPDPLVSDPVHALLAAGRGGEGDHLVRPTWNGLRPEDLELPQPPQDPEWRPDADR